MTYDQFTKEACETLNLNGVTIEDMHFAYIFFHQQAGESVEKSLGSVKALNNFQYES